VSVPQITTNRHGNSHPLTGAAGYRRDPSDAARARIQSFLIPDSPRVGDRARHVWVDKGYAGQTVTTAASNANV